MTRPTRHRSRAFDSYGAEVDVDLAHALAWVIQVEQPFESANFARSAGLESQDADRGNAVEARSA